MKSQAADFSDVRADNDPPHAERAAAAEAAAQHLLAEEEKEAAKAAAKKSKKQKQKVKKQARQQQQEEEEEEENEEKASTAMPEDAGSPTTSDHEQQSGGLGAAVTAGDDMAAEADGTPATPDASSQTLSGSDRHTHQPHTLVSDPEAVFGMTDPPLPDLPTADSREAAAGLHPREGASGVADASHVEDAVTSSFQTLDMGDTGQIARLLSCPITKVVPIAMRTSTFKLLGPSRTVCCCLLHSAAFQNTNDVLEHGLPCYAVWGCDGWAGAAEADGGACDCC